MFSLMPRPTLIDRQGSRISRPDGRDREKTGHSGDFAKTALLTPEETSFGPIRVRRKESGGARQNNSRRSELSVALTK